MFRSVRVPLAVVLGSLLVAAVSLPVHGALPVKNPPFGKVVKASFKLGRNMACTGDGLIVGKRGITINLNGKRIRGDRGPDDFGILNEGFRGVTIRSGRLVEFDQGVKLDEAIDNTIKGVKANSNASSGVSVVGGSGHRLSFVVATGNGGDGIDVEDANRITLLDSKARDSGDDGIEVLGDDNVLRRNHACGSFNENFHLAGSFISTANTEDAVC